MQPKFQFFPKGILLVFSLLISGFVFGQATVLTDKPDYQPGDTVEITGTGWWVDEEVSLHLVSDCGCVDTTFTVTANSLGNIYDKSFLITADHLQAKFILTATGSVSNQISSISFTDAGAAELLIMPSNVSLNSSRQYAIAIRLNNNIGATIGSIRVSHPENDWLSTFTIGTIEATGSKNWTASYDAVNERFNLVAVTDADRLSVTGE